MQSVYFVVWFDYIFYSVRDEGRVEKKAIYVVIGSGLDGRRGLLGFWIASTEGKGFWLGVLNDLRS